MSWTRHVFRQDSLGPLAGIGFVFVLYGVLRWASSSSSPRALQWPTRAVPRSAFSGSCRSAKMNGREDQDQARKWQSNEVQHHHPIASSKQASGTLEELNHQILVQGRLNLCRLALRWIEKAMIHLI